MFYNNLKLFFQKFIYDLNPQPMAAMAGVSDNHAQNVLFFAKKRTSQGDEQREVQADRRRKTPSQGQRERAQAPSRDQSKPSSSSTPTYTPSGGGGSYVPPSSGSGGFSFPSSGGSSGGGFNPLMLLIAGGGLILLLCVGAFFLFRGGSSSGGDQLSGLLESPANSSGGFGDVQQLPEIQQETQQEVPSSSASSNVAPPKVGEGNETWLVMLYQDADDKILEEDIYVDLNEAERVGSSDNVHVVSQVDRYKAGYSGDGNWTDTRRYYLTYDPDLDRVSSQELLNLGEVNMASGDSLVDFVTWAVDAYPSDNYVLILSDHGMGWPGGWTDADPGGQGPDRVALAQATGDQLFLMELDEALTEVRQRTGIDKLELVGMDACLMGHVEVFDMLAQHAKYAVASQEVEPALGWAYTGFLSSLLANPDVDGGDLGDYIVSSYIDDDQRIVDDQARLAWVGRGKAFGLPSALQLKRQISDDVTLAAIDLQKIPQVMDDLNNLAYLLQSDDQRGIAQARNYAQSFTSVFGRSVPPSYLDLSNLISIIRQSTSNSQVQQAVDALQSSLDEAIIAERHGQKKPGATGMSIYFPNSQLYRNQATGAQSYAEIASRFAEDSLWDDFLAYHYIGQQFSPADTTLATADPALVVAPGQGAITVGALQVSADNVDIGETVKLSADIEGENIGYIKFFAGFLDEASNSIYVADTDYLDSGETREVDGVYYPDWGEGAFTLSFDWEPIVFAIDDGDKRVVSLFEPEVYGASVDDAVYSVDGIYTYADGEQFRSTMYFNNNDGYMREIFGFNGSGTTGTPREILPSSGDTFTVLERWLEVDSTGQPAREVTEMGKTVDFGNQQLSWVDLDAVAGPYMVGFLIEDLDGNVYPVYAEVTVN
ncbi:MAG: clostripain-related cysteine peptidase [Candidatus Promineifilaceae bacterium]|jgi:hypothetical protein